MTVGHEGSVNVGKNWSTANAHLLLRKRKCVVHVAFICWPIPFEYAYNHSSNSKLTDLENMLTLHAKVEPETLEANFMNNKD